MKKKLLISILCCIVISSLFVGCGTKENVESATDNAKVVEKVEEHTTEKKENNITNEDTLIEETVSTNVEELNNENVTEVEALPFIDKFIPNITTMDEVNKYLSDNFITYKDYEENAIATTSPDTQGKYDYYYEIWFEDNILTVYRAYACFKDSDEFKTGTQEIIQHIADITEESEDASEHSTGKYSVSNAYIWHNDSEDKLIMLPVIITQEDEDSDYFSTVLRLWVGSYDEYAGTNDQIESELAVDENGMLLE